MQIFVSVENTTCSFPVFSLYLFQNVSLAPFTFIIVLACGRVRHSSSGRNPHADGRRSRSVKQLLDNVTKNSFPLLYESMMKVHCF